MQGMFGNIIVKKHTQNKHGAHIITKREQKCTLIWADTFADSQVCGHLGTHRITAQETGDDCKRAISRYAWKKTHERFRNPADKIHSVCLHHHLCQDHKWEKRGKHIEVPQYKSFQSTGNDCISVKQKEKKDR